MTSEMKRWKCFSQSICFDIMPAAAGIKVALTLGPCGSLYSSHSVSAKVTWNPFFKCVWTIGNTSGGEKKASLQLLVIAFAKLSFLWVKQDIQWKKMLMVLDFYPLANGWMINFCLYMTGGWRVGIDNISQSHFRGGTSYYILVEETFVLQNKVKWWMIHNKSLFIPSDSWPPMIWCPSCRRTP